ncbi:MAG: hypothetical protein WCE62_15305 [Polyangiales bacterium]
MALQGGSETGLGRQVVIFERVHNPIRAGLETFHGRPLKTLGLSRGVRQSRVPFRGALGIGPRRETRHEREDQRKQDEAQARPAPRNAPIH